LTLRGGGHTVTALTKEGAMADRVFFDYGLTFVQPVSLPLERTALVVVDMQYHDAAAGQGYCAALEAIDPGSCAYFDERNENLTVPTIARLVEGFRARDLQIVYLCLGAEQQDMSDLPPRMAAWIRDVEERSGIHDIFWRGNPLYAIRAEFAPRDGDLVVHKKTFGAFNSSNLDEVLQDHGIDTLVICGISTNCCVETTARDAADRGYGVVIVDDACADYDEAAHDASLRGFHFNFGRVVRGPDEVFAAIDSGVPV
jgi:biuret amidohydrolase